MELIEAEHPRPRHFLLHLSDPHLLGGPQPLHGAVDSDALLRQLFEEVHASGARPEAVIFTGDLADQGEPEAYAKLRAIVEPACRAMGARVIWAMGNHDDRANFRAGLLDQPGDDAPVDHSYYVNGLRIITLDTSVPGFHHGELSQDAAGLAGGGTRNPGAGRDHPCPAPPAGPVRAGPRRARGTPRPGGAGRRAAQLRCPRHPGRPPALFDHGDLRRHPGVRGLGHLLHAGPECSGGRHPRPRRRRRPSTWSTSTSTRSCTPWCRSATPRRWGSSSPPRRPSAG